MGHGIPVLMYHSIGRVLADWHWAVLTLPAPTFEDHLRALARGGFTTVGLPELFEYMSGRRTLPERTVVLTLDDGYVDNWTYAVPLLRRYGFCATVLVTPEFVDPRDLLRPTLEDVWAGRGSETDLEVRGFMTWRELAAAAADGALSVESHALTHTWYPTSADVVDFHHPGDAHYWLDWNAAPAEKPFYLQHLGESRVAWGTPVYRHAKSLAARAYHPDPGEGAYLMTRAAEAGGERLFARSDWRDVLNRALSDFRADHGVRGEPESDRERRARFERELAGSKQAIEARLGKPVRHLVWPGGGYCDESMDMALTIYDSVTWSGVDRWTLRNRPGEDPRRVT
ncbi:MAG TPA: polysaccharide deacetylase family protein, partial [Candidatus Krumholzibacteria bacterium]|nr:polysaccharide deacetylase family protein [Candidatus Krumholzibacteria bacterium]